MSVTSPRVSMSVLLREDDGAITTLTLHRPDRLNAVSVELYASLQQHLDDLATRDQTRVIVLTGAGRAFCVGADLKAYGARTPDDDWPRTYIEAGQRVYRGMQTHPKAIVAAVNGHAIGAGIELALSCDLIVVAEDAKLRIPELHLGTFVGGGTIYTLADRVGLATARELMLLGEFFSGTDAHGMGLANRAVPSADVLPVARTLAFRLAAAAPVSVRHARRLLDLAQYSSHDEAMSLEAEALLECMRTRDWQEGVDAFREKRDPDFTGE